MFVQLIHDRKLVAVYLMTRDELAELLTPIGCESAGFTSPNQQWSTLSWGFHTVWSGIDPWDHRLDSRLVGIAEIWKCL